MSEKVNETVTAGESAENGSETGSNGVQTAPKKRGAPLGNTNNLQHGAFSREIQKAKRRKLRGKAKRLQVETLQALLADQGNLDDVPVTLHFICQRFAKRVARLHVMDRAVDRLIAKNPRLKENPKALATFYELVRPLENDALNDAKTIGLERKSKSPSLAELFETEGEEENRETDGS